MKIYRVLLLDVDDTLLDFKADEREALKKVLGQFGLSADDEVFARYSEINRALWLAHERGEIPRQTIWERRFAALFEAFHLSADGPEAERLYRAALGEGGHLIPGAFELCRALSRRYALYLVTNGTAATQYSRIRRAGLDRWVRETFISEEIGFPKPAPQYFDAVFEKIPFSREEALIIGDSLTSDIQGGFNAGVDTCWYNPGRKESGGLSPTYEIHTLIELNRILKHTGE